MRFTRVRSAVRHPVLAVGCVCAVLVLGQTPTSALEVDDLPDPVTGHATWFSGLGGPYGGCGRTQDSLETQDFVALNVYNTPGDYTYYPRPLTGENFELRGMWNNGHNCGRWVRVTMGDYCTGTNDGAQSKGFCREGSWVADKYNGATLDMLVADSCGDDNAWCRDDPYHLDFNRDSINRFALDGEPVGDLDPEHWNNRRISWNYIDAPGYSGDIEIGFLQGAQSWWSAISIGHLRNGIHGVEYYAEGAWGQAEMDADMGQAYVIKPLQPGGDTYRIRVRDVKDELVNDGRVYGFSLPEKCDPHCTPAYTKIDYWTAADPNGPGPTPTGVPGTCTAKLRVTDSWHDGYQAEVDVTAGTKKISAWDVGWKLAAGQGIGDTWGGVFTKGTDGTVTVKNAVYNGMLSAGGSTSFGFTGTGTDSPGSPELTCTVG
jgi:hypothetical protein